VNGRPAGAGHARQRAVFAVLLLDLGRAVPLEVLIDRVWGEDPPGSVRNVVYGHVARLRALIASGQDPAVTLSRGAGGYLLQAGPDQVDLGRFRRLVAGAAAAAGDDERAGAALGEAVALWRGPALYRERQPGAGGGDLGGVGDRGCGQDGAGGALGAPGRRPVPRRAAACQPVPLADQAAAREWLDTERASLVAVAVYAAGNGWPGHATRLAAVLFRYLLAGSYQTTALGNLGAAALRQGRCEQAARYQQQSLALARKTGNQHIESHALYSLGEVDLQQSRYSQASEHLRQALALSRQTGNRVVESYALTCLGAVDLGLGRHEHAIGHLQQALALTRETGFRSQEASALNGLGEVFLAVSRPADALTQYEMALAIASQAGLKYEQAQACDGLGRALSR
jgi:Tetratricopeptide repeat/Transcriptional regulatory protein, C terminal/Bacterial transcriptional activator domain